MKKITMLCVISIVLFSMFAFGVCFAKHPIRLNNIKETYECIVVGAGPAGLQCGYFLKKYNIPYVILEKNDSPGSFFQKYPVHGALISINKVYTGNDNKEFNLRHDWNSLLSDDESLLLKHYTKEYFPDRQTYVKYLKDFYTKHALNVHFNIEVASIQKKDNAFILATNRTEYRTPNLIDATGYATVKPIDHFFKGTYLEDKIIDYSELTMDKEMFVNKHVAIVGTANSGFETADYLTDVAASITLIGPVPQHAWQTHYVGDVRAVNSKFFDTYQLKSSNKIITRTFSSNAYVKEWLVGMNDYQIDPYDFVINCTGWRPNYDMYDASIKPHVRLNMPEITPEFESVNVSNLYFAGALMHNISGKKSSPSFIHGFRYLIRFLVKRFTNNLTTFHFTDKENLLAYFVERINTTSGLYQMFDVLVDVIVVHSEHDFEYIQEVPMAFAEKQYLNKHQKILVAKLKYGDGYGGKMISMNVCGVNYVLGEDRVRGDTAETADRSLFLHPVIEYYRNGKKQKEHHMSEHVDTRWDHPIMHVAPLKKFIDELTNI